MTQRQLFLIGFLICAGLIAAAMYFQYVKGLEPCPLCIAQRLCIMAVGVVLLLGALHNPAGWGRRLYGALTVVFAGLGASIAARHVWLQNLPPDKQPGCGFDLGYMLERFPLLKAFKLVWAGTSDCASITWTFLGLSMPAWTLVFFVGFMALGIVLLFTRLGATAFAR